MSRPGWARRASSPARGRAVAGFPTLALAPQLWSVTLGLAVVAAGLGLAMPGYTAGPTLRVDRTEHGSVAGLLNANNETRFIVGPLLGTTPHVVGPVWPMWLSAACCLAGTVVAVANRQIGAVTAGSPAPDPHRAPEPPPQPRACSASTRVVTPVSTIVRVASIEA